MVHLRQHFSLARMRLGTVLFIVGLVTYIMYIMCWYVGVLPICVGNGCGHHFLGHNSNFLNTVYPFKDVVNLWFVVILYSHVLADVWSPMPISCSFLGM